MTNQVLKENLDTIKQVIPEKNEFEKPIWQGIADLIEESNFGTTDAEVHVEITLQEKGDPYDQDEAEKLDSIQREANVICFHLFNEHGQVKLLTYSQGMPPGQKCITFKFTAKTK